MADISVAELRQHITTEVGDAALQRILDDAQEEIDERFPKTNVTERFRVGAWNGPVVLSRRASAIVSVTEEVAGGTPRLLVADDYRLEGGYRVYRLSTGTTPAYGFAYEVVIEYTPAVQTKRRAMVLVDLAKLELSPGATGATSSSRTIGDYSESDSFGGSAGSSDSFEKRRKAILRRLAPRGGFVMGGGHG